MTDLSTIPERDSGTRSKRPIGRLFGAVVYWMPVWIPLGVLAQLGLRGLKPALLEDQRLTQAEVRLTSRVDALRADRDELEHQLSAFEDPIYIERLRRMRDED
jgi:hypothetical protein